MDEVKRGDIWLFDPEPVKGREQGVKNTGELRPCLILSNNLFNQGPAGLVIVIPMTTKDRSIPSHITIMPQDADVKKVCYAMCEQIRTISKERLKKKWGILHERKVFANIIHWIVILLDI